MDGLMMDYQLTLPTIMRRAETYFGMREVVSRLHDRSFHRCTYADVMRRARQLAVGLAGLGLERGDRVATLCWNHYRHLEAYYGVSCQGLVLHTLNLRLHPDDLAYIASHAGDRVLIVDASLLSVAEQFLDRTRIEHVLVCEDSYERLLESADPDDWVDPELREDEAAAMCYTSGTTGRPKGVVYSHRSTVLHTFGVAASNPLGLGISDRDAILPVVPMFHANAWGYPYACPMIGTKLVLAGQHADPESLLETFVQEQVTWSAGVPTVWLGILQLLDADPDRWDLSHMKGMLVGGAAAPRSMVAGFRERHNLQVSHGWGMTETSPVAARATVPSDLAEEGEDEQIDHLSMQGFPLPFVEVRARDLHGNEIPHDGETMAELEIRGPWIAAGYYENAEQIDRWTDDGWFLTGDIVSIHPRGFIQIKDRAKDVIKSGGEWISSVELENALMAHPAVHEAAVIAIPDEKWQERPLAAVVLRPDGSATAEELREFLAPRFAKWWLPDRIEFVPEIPKTAVGKFRKTELREQFAGQPAASS
jgi:fatty-acyl-CoA synthase